MSGAIIVSLYMTMRSIYMGAAHRAVFEHKMSI